ncbi:MAG: hypothetical protein HYX87_00715 [Chloroflexi bacterium]|nr:hypothetical protein [Chloroflexota bacterium]
MDKTKGTALRVVVASETPELRDQIVQLVEREPGVKVVGQASNAIEVIARAKILKPEVTVVDPYLPYQFGLDGIPLSRMSGLDAAMSVAEEPAGGMAILLSNVNPLPSRDNRLEASAELCRYAEGFYVPLSLRHLQLEAAPMDRVVFADVWAGETPPLHHKALTLSDNLLVWGGLALVAGLALMLTLIMVIVGAPLAAGGLFAILVGLAIKGVVRCLRGSVSREGEPPE